MTDDEDPFESFDAPDDVDPFEDLEGPEPEGPDPEDDSGDEPAADESPDSTGGAWADEPFGGGETTGDPSSGAVDDGPSDDPFAAFSETVGRDDPDDDPFEAFESAGVDEVDPDAVWDALSAAEEEGMPEFDEKVYYEVSKHAFCERCEYFSGPPETSCTYDGAAIVEFLDMETVRLLNCPVVAEQRELEESVGKIGPD